MPVWKRISRQSAHAALHPHNRATSVAVSTHPPNVALKTQECHHRGKRGYIAKVCRSKHWNDAASIHKPQVVKSQDQKGPNILWTKHLRTPLMPCLMYRGKG